MIHEAIRAQVLTLLRQITSNYGGNSVVTPTNFENEVITQLQRSIVAAGGSVPTASSPGNFDDSFIGLLAALAAVVAPPVYVAPAAAGRVYTPSQSSVYGGATATYASLTNASNTDGGGTNNSASTEWIMADFGQAVTVSTVTCQGGAIPGWDGNVAQYLAQCQLQFSVNGATWQQIGNLPWSAVTNAAPLTFTLLVPIAARYWRLAKVGWCGTSLFSFT